MRPQFPLYKLFLVVAAYAAALGVFSPLGAAAWAPGLGFGTAAAGLVLAIRTRKDLLEAVNVAVGSLISGLIVLALVGARLGTPVYGAAQAARFILTLSAVCSVGAILGGLFFSIARKEAGERNRRRRRTTRP